MKRQSIFVLLIFMLCINSPKTLANVTYVDGGIHTIDSFINDVVWVDDSPSGDATTVNIVSGGGIGVRLTAVGNSKVNMLGGSVEHMQAFTNSTITVSDGTIGVLDALTNSYITISGGVITEELAALHNSQVIISGGTIEYIVAWTNSQVNISDGLIFGLQTITDSQVTVSGGSIEDTVDTFTNSQLTISGGSMLGLRTYTDSQVDISGGLINGNISVFDHGLITIYGREFNLPAGLIEATSGTLTGILASGEVIDVGFYRGYSTSEYGYDLGTIDLVIIPVPGALVLTGIGIGFVTWLRSHKKL